MLREVIYHSIADARLSENDLQAILHSARANNAANGITGCLFHGGNEFLQILEGDKEAVEACLIRIEQDFRHSNLTLLADHHIEQRAFDSWQMAYQLIDPERTPEWQGIMRSQDFQQLLEEPTSNSKGMRVFRAFAKVMLGDRE